VPEIAFLFYENMAALDAVGPYEILARLPDADVKFASSTPGPTRTDVGLVLVADSRLDDVPAPDIIVVPGGPGTLALRLAAMEAGEHEAPGDEAMEVTR
jgi:putative intracellular protease/amidase